MHASGEFDGHAVALAYSIDSRTIAPGELFFAVKGERLDGHDYVEEALKKGAIAAVVSSQQVHRYSCKTNLLLVNDTTLALQQLGAAVRRMWGKPLIGVTGSAGKTTTKDAIAHLLSTQMRVLKNEGNFNNHFGLPLTLLRLEPEHDIAVIEMGMSHAGEITALAEIAKPEWGVVTVVGPAHLENFDSISGIARAKYELIAALPKGGVAVLNADDEYVSQFGRDFHGKVVFYGIDSHTADIRAEKIVSHGDEGSSFELVVDGAREPVKLQLVGRHSIYNCLAAVAVAVERHLKPSEIALALGSLRAADKRGQIVKLKGATLIVDCYNSNPKALDSLVGSLAEMPAQRRIVVAGEMLELGPTSADLHRKSGAHMGEKRITKLLGVRGNATHIVEGAAAKGVDAEFVETPEQAGEWLVRELREGDVVLLKASRGVRLEKALEVLKEKFGSAVAVKA
jgi:UDP-N-acetylmuramoyl-tripeptide--D-alanyl-D-alanine ligase